MDEELTNRLAGLVAGQAMQADGLASVDADAWLAAADHHGVGPLLAERLAGRSDVPAVLAARLREVARIEASKDLIREVELAACLESLDRAGVAALVMKGAQLAHTHYQRPDLRPRMDSDVLIPGNRREDAALALTRLGYAPSDQIDGTLVMSQTTFARHRGGTVVHAIDVHWRMANPHVFANYLGYDELSQDAAPLAALGPSARGLSDLHALVVACVHRVAHHYDSDRLIWLYDIHLLASRLPRTAWATVYALAEARGVSRVVAASLERTARHFGTALPVPPSEAAVAVEGRRTAKRAEATSVYLESGRRHVERVAADLKALPRWSDRVRLVREHLLPSAEYMRTTYARSSRAPLPVLYVRRVLRGARKWLSRSA